MDPVHKIPIRRFSSGRFASTADDVISETRIELDINDGQLTLAMLCLPQDLEAMAIGFLRGEGVLSKAAEVREIKVTQPENKVLVRGDFDAEALEAVRLRWTWATGCGAGGTGRDLSGEIYKPVGQGPVIHPDKLLGMMADFHHKTSLWRQTGGVHACALADTERIILFAEDVGRHNAFDKIMGMATMDNIPLEDKLALTTGRLSAEIVSKAVACRLSVLVSRGAVTDLAAELARRFGLTLVGFARGRRLNVYTGYQRIACQEDRP